MSHITISDVPIDSFKVNTKVENLTEERSYYFSSLDEMISFISGEMATDYLGNIKRLNSNEIVIGSKIELDNDKLMEMICEECMER